MEKVPRGACIVACKHQSLWETFALYVALDDPTYILKRELMWIRLRLVRMEGAAYSRQSKRGIGGAGADDARSPKKNSAAGASSLSFPKARDARPALSRATNPA